MMAPGVWAHAPSKFKVVVSSTLVFCLFTLSHVSGSVGDRIWLDLKFRAEHSTSQHISIEGQCFNLFTVGDGNESMSILILHLQDKVYTRVMLPKEMERTASSCQGRLVHIEGRIIESSPSNRDDKIVYQTLKSISSFLGILDTAQSQYYILAKTILVSPPHRDKR